VNQTQRVQVAQETLQIIEQGYYQAPSHQRIDIREPLQQARQDSIYYHADQFAEIFNERDRIRSTAFRYTTRFEVTPEKTLEAAERLTKSGQSVFCLNFASAKNPGGGFLGGSQAQEESIARSSGLYHCLLPITDYYRRNRQLNTCLYTDDMIYSPAVPVFRNDAGNLLEKPYTLSMLTAPAVNAGVVNEREPENVGKIDAVMQLRLEKILSIAVVKGYRTLLLGAWGCGVFRNNPERVAGYFQDHLHNNPVFNEAFENVVFAIYTSGREAENINSFTRRFSQSGI
jgi:uncharacterized protein (TIGR02452 family)